jgi:putative GTP pyrophosphokinase
MPMALSREILRQIDAAVKVFEQDRVKFETDAANLQTRLLSNRDLKKLIHSSKWRAKEPSHLRDKLIRRASEAIGSEKRFDITAANLFEQVHDLAGVRLLHLHMRQMARIHPLIIEVLRTEGYILRERKQKLGILSTRRCSRTSA